MVFMATKIMRHVNYIIVDHNDKSQITAIRGKLGRAPQVTYIAANVNTKSNLIPKMRTLSMTYCFHVAAIYLKLQYLHNDCHVAHRCNTFYDVTPCRNTDSDFSDRRIVKKCLWIHYSNL